MVCVVPNLSDVRAQFTLRSTTALKYYKYLLQFSMEIGWNNVLIPSSGCTENS